MLRLLKQLSQVYSVMKIDRLKQLIPFLNFGQVEAIIVDAVKNEYIQVLDSTLKRIISYEASSRFDQHNPYKKDCYSSSCLLLLSMKLPYSK